MERHQENSNGKCYASWRVKEYSFTIIAILAAMLLPALLSAAEDFTIRADKKIIAPGENLNFELIRNSEGHLMHGVGFHAFYPDVPLGIGQGKVVFTRKANRLVDTCYIFLPQGRTRWFPRQLHALKKISHTLNTEGWPEGDYRIGVNLVTQNPAKKQIVVKRHVWVKVRKKQATPEQLLAKEPWRTNFKPLQKVKTTAQTRFKITSDAQNIYVLAEALEPHTGKLKAIAPNGSGRIWMDDDLEFAVSPFRGKSIQYLWMVNSKGSVCELFQQDNNTGSGELVDQHILHQPNGDCRIMVFERYYWRSSNRATLTVTVDNFSGRTRVHSVGSGGGQGAIFRFDWGASSSFAGIPQKALADFLC